MGFKLPWWVIVIWIVALIPIFPFLLLNKLTSRSIKPLDWLVELYLEFVFDRLV